MTPNFSSLPAALPAFKLSRIRIASLLLTLSTGLTSQLAMADEGQWQPHQLPLLSKELKNIGITIPAEKLADLKKHPMSAMVSLGGCSASFVSESGLVVTNHHCAYGAIQRNSTASNNYISEGFLATSLDKELPAGSSSRMYITDKLENVTAQVHQGLTAKMSGKQREEKIAQQIKKLIAECEKADASEAGKSASPATSTGTSIYHCTVPSFHRGLEYYLIRQMMIRDVRLVYAPSDKIGNFGGDVDNFEWPRHTGDYAFLRAYVGKDGRPADPSPDNVPYTSKDFLRVSAQGIKAGDPILLAGYPGRTSRYKLASEIRQARDVLYPARVADMHADLDVIAAATKNNPETVVRYASVVKSINNGLKKTEGLLSGFARKDIAAIKDVQDQQFRTWLSSDAAKATLSTGSQLSAKQLLQQLDEAIAAEMTLAVDEYAWSGALHSDLLRVARNLYRLSLEQQKPDEQRESGYQQRDISFIKARMQGLEKNFDAGVDQARYTASLQRFHKIQSGLHTQIDALLPTPDAASVSKVYAKSELNSTAQRLAWMDKKPADFLRSEDAFIQLAVKLYSTGVALENRRKEVDGNLERIIPQYMQALIAWKTSLGKPVYPDANSTLRVTYGTVSAYSPKDGISKGPFTTVQGLLEKQSDKAPFILPAKLVEAIKQQRFGQFKDPVLGQVPVNFLSSADTTGGNSGSAILNKDGLLIGLNFDSTYESVTKDWYFDNEITRAIHLDIRYMLWVMKEVDHADNLLKEMTITY